MPEQMEALCQQMERVQAQLGQLQGRVEAAKVEATSTAAATATAAAVSTATTAFTAAGLLGADSDGNGAEGGRAGQIEEAAAVTRTAEDDEQEERRQAQGAAAEGKAGATDPAAAAGM